MSDKLRQEIIEIVAKELDVDPTKIDPASPIIIYGADSFSFFNLKYNLEQKYQKPLFVDYPIEEATVNRLVLEVQPAQET